MFSPKYEIDYLAYANEPSMSYYTTLRYERFWTIRGCLKYIAKNIAVRVKNKALVSEYQIWDCSGEEVKLVLTVVAKS